VFNINTSFGEFNDYTQGSLIPVSFTSRNKAIHSVLQGFVLNFFLKELKIVRLTQQD